MAELTVLGTCGAWPEPGRACSGFLLSDNGFHVVADLGYGTVGALLAHRPDGAVDAVVITHEHPDHCVDLSALARVRYYQAREEPRIPLFCPPGVLRVLRCLEPSVDPTEVFDVHDLTSPRVLGSVRLTPVPLEHHVPNFGVRIASETWSVAYTGDTGPCDALVDLAEDVDLFIAEATLREPSPTGPHYLMTAAEAAAKAREARARRLLLTHTWPGSDREAAAHDARAVFDGEVLIAEEGMVLPLG